MLSDWIRSSFCDANGCVEVRVDGDMVDVRSDERGRMVVFSRAEWGAFLDGVKAGEFDLLEAGQLRCYTCNRAVTVAELRQEIGVDGGVIVRQCRKCELELGVFGELGTLPDDWRRQ